MDVTNPLALPLSLNIVYLIAVLIAFHCFATPLISNNLSKPTATSTTHSQPSYLTLTVSDRSCPDVGAHDMEKGDGLTTKPKKLAPGVTLSPPFRLFDLPQEPQDTISELAYTRSNSQGIVFKVNHDLDEQDAVKRLSPIYTILPFPPLTVSSWMIDKPFFLAAAKAFFASNALNGFVNFHTDCTASEQFLAIDNGLFIAYAGSIYLEWYLPHMDFDQPYEFWVKKVANCSSLKYMSVAVDERPFQSLEPNFSLQRARCYIRHINSNSTNLVLQNLGL